MLSVGFEEDDIGWTIFSIPNKSLKVSILLTVPYGKWSYNKVLMYLLNCLRANNTYAFIYMYMCRCVHGYVYILSQSKI